MAPGNLEIVQAESKAGNRLYRVSRCCIIMAIMGVRSAFLPLLMLCFLIFRQPPEQNAAHIKAWTERRARYMSEPRIEETESFVEITANSPRPLDDILAALSAPTWPQYRPG